MMGSEKVSKPMEDLTRKSVECKLSLTDVKFARLMDQCDPMSRFRQQFCIPKLRDLPVEVVGDKYKDSNDECLYLCCHSLGLMPKSTPANVERQLNRWAAMGVLGHHYGDMPWEICDEFCIKQSARLVGAQPDEVSVMSQLTINEHLLLISFYRPTPSRHKILIEDHAFPSDHYCVESQIRQRGYDPKTSMICIKPRSDEDNLRTEDIVELLNKEGDSIAVVLLPGVQYYTGQVLDMKTITTVAQSKGCYVGFDLAHAIGIVEIELHDWNVDFACWCSYKYLNSGAGSIGGLFVHERHAVNDFPRLLGWWSHRFETRFQMNNVMELSPGAAGFRVSNPSGLSSAAVKASLDIFSMTSMSEVRAKSKLLTAYMDYLLLTRYGRREQQSHLQQQQPQTNDVTPNNLADFYLRIITPSDPDQRGGHLSIWFSTSVISIYKNLSARGVLLDNREPNVLRVGVNPFYNTFEDCHRFVDILTEVVETIKTSSNSV